MAGSNRRDLYLQVNGNVDPLRAAMKAGGGALAQFGGDVDQALTEVEQRFAQLASNVSTSAPASAFRTAFNGIRSAADQAITKTGKVNLDVSGAEEAAAAAEAQAAGLMRLSEAAQAAAAKLGAVESEEALFAVATRAAALTAQGQATALRTQATALARVRDELGDAAAESNEVVNGHNRMGTSGMIVEHVFRSFSDSVAAGQSPLRALSMEIPRAAEALQLFAQESGGAEGVLGKFASFMGGPWGMALTLGTTLLAPLAEGLLEGGDAAEKDAASSKNLTDALEELSRQSDQATRTTEAATTASHAAAVAKDVEAQAVLRVANAKYQEAKADQARADAEAQRFANSGDPTNGGAAGGAGLLSWFAGRATKKAESGSDDAMENALKGMDLIRSNSIGSAIKDAEARTSDSTAAIRQYNQTRDKLVDQLRTFQIGRTEFDRQMDAATRTRDAITEYKAPHKAKLGSGEEYSLAAARAKLATSTDALTTAEAQLAIVQAQRASLTPAAYQAALVHAEQLVDLAKATKEVSSELAVSSKAGFAAFDRTSPTREVHKELDQADKGRSDAADYLFQKRSSKPMDDFRAGLQESVGDTNRAFSSIKVDALQGVENAFEGILSGSQSVSAAVKKMVSSILADFARMAVEKGLLALLSGGKGGGGGFMPDALSFTAAPLSLGEGHATGGHITGPGSGTSDSILARLSNGEFVVNSAATKRFLPLLHAINDNHMPAFATGGPVGAMAALRYPSISAGSLAAASVPRFTVEAVPNPYFDVRVRSVSGGVVKRRLHRRPLPARRWRARTQPSAGAVAWSADHGLCAASLISGLSGG